MYHITLVIAAALLGGGCRSANVNKHMKMLPQIDNNIESNVVSTKQSPVTKLLAITRRPNVLNPHPPGTTVELTCEAYGTPAPSIHWYKNDVPVYEHDMESNELIDTNPASLARVVSTLLVTRTDEQDEYTCLVKSGTKVARASSTVYRAPTDGNTEVTERSKLIPLEPRILVSYKAYIDTIGSNVMLPCRVRGHPRPHITWTWKNNNGTSGTVTKNTPRMKVLRSGELIISPLRWSDMGEFTCRATNVFGSQYANTFVYPAKAG
ncbi:neural/ectodermal development factor IMP-L2-like [Achroia grisella]|uniref:neural/ectodermal development factor IMP-L2-like n=1 Tax=Achroia grisella TaxID=688607 RepID=UPI0027D2B86B|nr:neural/ectodermal development factor IMP-L2-like [Achroia grisella]XP_059054472.1 neural/ectodermal development factor IMP-L2-like [Achroia grisella]